MALRVLEVTSKKLLDVFIRLQAKIHQNDPNWITPLDMERRALLDPAQNPYFEHAKAKYWLAEKDGKFVGRISAQIDEMAIKERGEPVGHFGMFACENDPDIAKTLLETAENWLREQGMTKVQGPMNLSINQEVGLMVEGFDTPSMMLMPHDQPYLQQMIKDAGYQTAVNMLAYIRDADTLFPDSLRKLAERNSGGKVVLRKLDMKRYTQEIETIVSIFNEGWHTNWGFVPMTETEVKHMGKELRPIINPELTCFAEIDGEAAGFLVCVPDVNSMLHGLDGKLLPFGWAKLLWRMKVRGPTTARVMLMGVRKKYSAGLLGQFLPFRLIYFIEAYLKKSSIEQVEMGWILEDNKPIRRLIERVGGKAYKKYQVFEKLL
ncbi:MAG: GNAT family N-acetyltransferase [Robiginitomaculum sp.]|nr:GNAT family N-acetyltransferase [Robiginitomaculum sp.]